ncbi:MAG: hypothetical protein R2770_08000 [Acidimicrobiales bacterium]
MASSESDDLRDAAYTAIGFAVLGFQRLQVKRRQLEREFGSLARSWTRHGSEWLEER